MRAYEIKKNGYYKGSGAGVLIRFMPGEPETHFLTLPQAGKFLKALSKAICKAGGQGYNG